MKQPRSESVARRVVRFYWEGFREMTLGRTLWAIILLKLFILFGVLRLFFFPDRLAGYDDAQRAAAVRSELVGPAAKNP